MQGFSCYNDGQINAPAVLQTPRSMADSVSGLRKDETDMPKNSTPVSPSTKGRRKSTLALIGQTFGMLTVIGLGAPAHVRVQCDCGSEPKDIKPKELRRGYKSCGCQQRKG